MGAAQVDYRTHLPEGTSLADLRKRHDKMVEQAQYDHGHSGYSGTIAESQGLKVKRDIIVTPKEGGWIDWDEAGIESGADAYWLL